MDTAILDGLFRYGFPGIVVILILTGILVPGWVYRKTEQENEVLRNNLVVERQRNADLQQVAAMGQRALSALVDVAQEHRSLDAGHGPRREEPAVSSEPRG